MKLYTYSAARQRLAEVLEEASREGAVQIRPQDGRVYAVTPIEKPTQSPFANVTGRAVRGVTSKDLLRTIREEGRARGARASRRPDGWRCAEQEARGLKRRDVRGAPRRLAVGASRGRRGHDRKWRNIVRAETDAHPLVLASAGAIGRLGAIARPSTSNETADTTMAAARVAMA